MPVGVISHIPNPTFSDVAELAAAAEAAGASWLGLPDAFWWRDTWLLLAEAARATARLQVGPLVTNPYLRHPFHTAAALASLQELAGTARVFVGIGAGGSEVPAATGISRHDAPARIRGLVSTLRRVAAGEPLDSATGRRLEVPLRPLRVLVAGRGDRILSVAGECADSALLWAIPQSDLARSTEVITASASRNGRQPELVWAPLVDHGGQSRERVRTIAAYSVLNSHPALHARWNLDPATMQELRRRLVSGGASAAQDLVPPAALDDLILADASPNTAGRLAAAIGAMSLAVPAFTVEDVAPRVSWARDVLAASHSAP